MSKILQERIISDFPTFTYAFPTIIHFHIKILKAVNQQQPTPTICAGISRYAVLDLTLTFTLRAETKGK
jgi:hypothetical protein